MSLKTSLIEDLKSQREALGWNLGDLARQSGLDEQSLAGWERGTGLPELDALQNWAAALGMRIRLQPDADPEQGGVRIDWEGRRITIDGAPVRLTPMEWRALGLLARTPGELVSHQALYRHLYGEERSDRAQSTAVRVLITKLRRLLPLRIEARWGQGYVVSGIAPPPEANRHAFLPAVAAADAEPGCDPRPAAGALPAIAPAERPASASAPTHRLAITQRREPAGSGLHGLRHFPLSVHRSEELGIIDRFLAERGVTRCPDTAMIQKSPLPTLVWDKVKRKWVRPPAESFSAG
jgi:transcriptional regulator with XRE-family HTH domain